MNNVPVALICYNRPWHTFEVLKDLEEHDIQNLFIFSDAPKTEKDIENVLKTRSLFECIKWTKPEIIYQKENQGLAKSIVSAVNYAFEKYDRIILLEDDCLPRAYFFDFIHECLNRYEQNEKVFGITGYTVPLTNDILDAYPFDNYFFPRIGSWGWATWKRAWQYHEEDIKKLERLVSQKKIDMSQGGTDIPVNLNLMLQGQLTDVWTISWVLTVYLHGGCYVYPTRSHIENIGMDGSGLHCTATDKFISPAPLEKPKQFSSKIFYDPEICRHFRSFYDIPEPE